MEIASRCRLKAACLVWQPRAGAHALTILCKATFALRPGESRLAAEQEDPLMVDAYANDGRGSLIAASDMCPFKRRADVLFHGRAYTPSGPPTPSFVARLIVGKLDKSIEVRADKGSSLRHESSTAGFGPVAPTSPSRTALLGRYAKTWDPQTWNTRPLPDDMDGAFFNAAPADQQLPELTGAETIVLEHLSSVYPRLETRLSRIVPRATVRRENQDAQEVRLRCDTLSIDGDRGIATLVFRGVVLLSHPAEPGIVILTEGGEGLATESNSTHALEDQDNLEQDGSGTVLAPAAKLTGETKPALPFIAGASPLSAASQTREWYENPAVDDGTGTVLLDDRLSRDILPFQPSSQEMLLAPSAPAASLPSLSALELGPALSHQGRGALEAEVDLWRPIHVPPPPMMGPLPVPARPAPPEATAGELPSAAAEKPAAGAVDDREASPLEAPPIELSIEQVASIAAEIAEGKQDRAKVLETHGLREYGWSENERRWRTSIEEQAARGAHALQATYDAAYVARVERFRGALTVEEYARIVVALERGRTDEALDALKIQRPALMPIIRLWTTKVAKDSKLGDMASDALREAQRA
ncbi:DUF2169 family type VI secretion system accessory protein [Sorangium sp. So ce1335]|uniref:DUF2169 family type VI secretion system accessory protein n=1 Tax=Sorangium sp. So ce1335 TaxID=3133335 RepID=UPI003F640FCE